MKKLIPKNKQKLAYIRWQDAHSNTGWFDEEQLESEINHEKYIIESIGWIVYEDKDEVHMAARRGLWNKTSRSQYGLYERIPKAWILKKKVIIKTKTA